MAGSFASFGTSKPAAYDPINAAMQSNNPSQPSAAAQAAQQRADADAAQQRATTNAMALFNNNRDSATLQTNGRDYNVSIGPSGGGRGGSSSRASGVSIGNGVYPDASQLLSQFNQLKGAMGGPISPNAPPGLSVPSTVNAFAKGKDVSGRMGNAAIEALRNAMTRRGISDSGLAIAGEANILGNVANQQAQNVYDAQAQDTNRQWDANQLQYAGQQHYNDQVLNAQMAEKNQALSLLQSLMTRLY